MYRELLAFKLILLEVLEEIQEQTKEHFMLIRQITYEEPDIRNDSAIDEIYELAERLAYLQADYKKIVEILTQLSMVSDCYQSVKLPKNIEILPLAQNMLNENKNNRADEKYLSITRSDEYIDIIASKALDLFSAEEIPHEALRLYLEEFEDMQEDFNYTKNDIINMHEKLHDELGENWIVSSGKPLEYWALILEMLFKTMGDDEEFKELIMEYPDSYEREL